MSPRTCAYEPCSRSFTPTHPRQRFCCGTCRADDHYAKHPEKRSGALRCVAEPTLDDVRAQHEESKGRWTLIVREHLNRTLLVTGYVSAEDFDSLGIPDEHRNLANAQMGSYVRNGYMQAVTWRHSPKASRKSGKIWTYRITQKGRAKLAAGVRVDRTSEGTPSVGADSGGTPIPPDTGQQGSPETHIGASRSVSGESAPKLFEDAPPSAYDPWSEAA